MKKLLFLVLIVFCWQSQALFAQNTFHEIKGSSPSTSSFAGLNPLSKTGASRVRYLIRATDLTEATPAMSAGDLVSIGFIWSAIPTNGSVEDVTIRIAQSTDTDVSQGQPSGGFKSEPFTDVFSGDISGITVNNWVQVPFDAPFVWDGTNNLVVEICKTAGSGTAGTIRTHSTTPTYNTRRSANSGGCSASTGALNASTRAQIRFEIQGISPCDGTPNAGTASIVNNVAVCGAGSKDLVLAGYPTSEAGIELQWKESDQPGGPYTNVAGATENTFSTPVLTETKYYVCEVTCSFSAQSALSNEVAVEIANPMVVSTTDGFNCGFGEVTLEAEGNADATLRWFGSETGGNVLETGTTYTTPSLTETTTYYVEASSLLGPFIGAKLERTSSGTATPSNHGLRFDANSAFTLNSVDVYLASNNAGTLVIELREENGTVIQNGTFAVPAGNSSNPVLHTVPINFDVPVGTNLRLMAVNGPTLVRDNSGVSYPYPIGGLGSITAGLLNSDVWLSNYYYFYNWNVSSVCQSGRTPVEAVISCAAPCPIPDVAIDGTTTLCDGATDELSADIELNGTTISNYAWTLDGAATGANSPTLTIAEAGTYQLTVTTDNGCEFTSPDYVVAALASVDVAIGGILEICEGNTTTLTAIAATDEGTIESYLWYENGESTSETGETIEVSAAGTFAVEVTNSNGCTVLSNTVTVTENALTLPEISTEKTVLCEDETILLTASSGSSYLWNNNETTQVIEVTTAGEYSVTVTDGNGCSATSTVLTITDAPALDIPTITASSELLCAGSEITLTASEADNYTWNTAANTQSIIITEAGSFTVTITDENGCTATSAVTNISDAPETVTPIITQSEAVLCSGSEIELTASEATAYVWSNGATTPSISVTESGTFNVTITDENGCTATSADIEITALDNPTAPTLEATADGFCPGESVTITASEAFSYAWSNGAVSPSIEVDEAGDFSVTISDENGCTATSTVVSIAAYDAPETPTIEASAAGFCVGENVTITASEADGYLWSNQANTQTIEVSVAGNYTVTITDENGCIATSEEVTIDEYTLPNVTIATVEDLCLDDDAVSLQASPVGGTFSGTNVSGETFNPATEGTFEVTYTFTDENGCSNAASTNVVVEDCDDVSVSNIEGVDFKLYPNPSAGDLIIEISHVQDGAGVEITSISGQKIYATSLEQTKTQLNLNTLPSGAYFVRIQNGSNISTHKWVKN